MIINKTFPPTGTYRLHAQFLCNKYGDDLNGIIGEKNNTFKICMHVGMCLLILFYYLIQNYLHRSVINERTLYVQTLIRNIRIIRIRGHATGNTSTFAIIATIKPRVH